MSLNPTAATTLARPRRECAHGLPVGRGVDPAGAAGGGAENATMQGLTPFRISDFGPRISDRGPRTSDPATDFTDGADFSGRIVGSRTSDLGFQTPQPTINQQPPTTNPFDMNTRPLFDDVTPAKPLGWRNER